jgi:MFS family permease
MLVVARALQGMFGALLAPSALSLVTVTFAGSPLRPRAFGIFGAIAGAGGSLGLLLGGVLTQLLSWRWCLYVNLVIAVPTAIAAWRVLSPPVAGARPKLDVAGVVLASGGLFALVYGFSSAETSSWTSTATLVALAASPVLLLAFVLNERRSSHPLLPLHIVVDRLRGSMYLSIALAFSGSFGVFLFLTYYLQRSLHMSPLMTGVAFIPMNLSIVSTSTLVQTRVLPRIGPKIVVIASMACGLVAMLWFAQISPGDSYGGRVLPGVIVLGLGLGGVFASAFGTATLNIPREEAGVASAMVNTSQQVGGSIGASLLSTLFASAAASFLRSHHTGPAASGIASIHGYSVAFWWATLIYAVGLILAIVVPPPRSHLAFAVSQPAPAAAIE